MENNTPLTPQEVADMLKISKSTVYELIKKNSINSYKVGKKLRIDLKDVEEYKNKTKTVLNNEENNFKERDTVQLIGSLNNSYTTNYNMASQFIICGQDIILDILSRHLEMRISGIHNLRYYQGSYNSLYSLYKGKATIATAHMWDRKTGLYNTPFVEKMLPGTPCILINLAYINVGYYVAKGNPKNILSWDDLGRKDITIINREKGSGTRVLLDERIQEMKIPSRSIIGYERECLAHIAVASAIARGEADFGLGSEKASYQVKDIDFVPLQKEQYDLIIKKEDLNLPGVNAVLDIIRSEEFKAEVSSLGGYDVSRLGEVIGET
ncbi:MULTISPECIES: helix-turn-helix transcriptional regulator [unclassified Clostridium]|uniref:substrate-binding domain-containing protein n=1 Tax=unclassified Clostridium TaxID=2614128 RepID=UPI00029864C0|nr:MULTISPECIES: helix-turn-helix transcriptional regulator [unclassified Clostridium]EKQ52381.1 MAG: DNA-binding protein, excisionase family [Clostridium sp. Maddingley MBC34-26]